MIGHLDILPPTAVVENEGEKYPPSRWFRDLRGATVNTEPAVPAMNGKRRMLIIVVPYATTVSDRLKNLCRLRPAVPIRGRGRSDRKPGSRHGDRPRRGRRRLTTSWSLSAVMAPVNEVANGPAGTDIPVTFLPGGNTNVVCRSLGIPNDVVDATEHLLSLADDFKPRKIDLGKINDRHFVFALRGGIDATVVEQVDAN